ncbi:mannose-6-phosphate isomerase [Deinococcus aetherius]|uniref:Mannose-6-phosphate isomerase n=1 Tax=Deinococcus aetherius TaxID=200252 RepID=A0ABM8AH78_9DEIO|nr:cupin domain-containing protein [Deinococcus aetherius]BDP43156.1 mannose-6-phosphate isomerase [Deinococcus aetherius]
MSRPQTVSLQEKFDLFTDHWSPRIVGELNGQQVKLAKISGEFIWHAHEHEDELFLVTRGTLRMRFRTHEAVVGVGEFIIVPRGVEHQPVADTEEVWMLLFEPASTVNTGTAGGERTVTELGRL